MIKYIVTGRTCVGKKTFLKDLIKRGIRVNRSFTTNPDADAEIYEIITDEQAAKIQNKILVKEFGDFIYFTTQEHFDNADVISLDLDGLKTACESNPLTVFRPINIQMADDDRLRSFIANIPVEERITSEEDFCARCRDEDETYTTFEKNAAEGDFGFRNIILAHALINDATDTSPIFEFHKEISAGLRAFKRMRYIIEDLIREGTLEIEADAREENGTEPQFRFDDSTRVQYYTADPESGEPVLTIAPINTFVEFSVVDSEGIALLISRWFKCETISAEKLAETNITRKE